MCLLSHPATSVICVSHFAYVRVPIQSRLISIYRFISIFINLSGRARAKRSSRASRRAGVKNGGRRAGKRTCGARLARKWLDSIDFSDGSHFIHLSLSLFLSIYLSIDLCIYLSVCLSVYPSIYLPIYLCIHLCIYLLYLFYLSNYPSISHSWGAPNNVQVGEPASKETAALNELGRVEQWT